MLITERHLIGKAKTGKISDTVKAMCRRTQRLFLGMVCADMILRLHAQHLLVLMGADLQQHTSCNGWLTGFSFVV